MAPGQVSASAVAMTPYASAPTPTRKPTLPVPSKPGSGSGLQLIEYVESVLTRGLEDSRNVKGYLSAYNLFTAIDPSTGDSVLHRAARAGNVGFMENIHVAWGPNITQRPSSLQDQWVYMVHQNFAGDTALHAAARAGSKLGVKAVYRLFFLKSLSGIETDTYDPARPPVEYRDWLRSRRRGNEFGNLPALDFVCMKNKAGRDAVEEARAAGHEDLALWMTALVDRLDVDGRRGDEDYMRAARRYALESHWYLADEAESPVIGMASLSCIGQMTLE